MGLGTDVLSTELWSIVTELSLAWEKNCRHVCLETDSKEALEFVVNGCLENHSLLSVAIQVGSLVRREWEVRFQWIYREGNEAANWLAMAATNSAPGLRVLDKPPRRMMNVLQKDLGQMGQARWVAAGS